MEQVSVLPTIEYDCCEKEVSSAKSPKLGHNIINNKTRKLRLLIDFSVVLVLSKVMISAKESCLPTDS